MLKNEFITLIRLWGSISTLFMSIVLYATFLLIFLSENKASYVAINDYGEAVIELVIFSITLFLAFIGCVSLLMDKRIFCSSE